MCVCVCMCVCLCTCLSLFVHFCVSLTNYTKEASFNVRGRRCVCARVSVFVHVRVSLCMCVCASLCVYLCVCASLCVYLCVCAAFHVENPASFVVASLQARAIIQGFELLGSTYCTLATRALTPRHTCLHTVPHLCERRVARCECHTCVHTVPRVS